MDSANQQNTATWIDPKTGLEWQQACPGRMTWFKAKAYSASLVLAGKHDWRLPTLAELESLLDRTRSRADGRPLVREDVPFSDTLSYWSSTTFENRTRTAWIVVFDGGYVLSYPKKNSYAVRCVRSRLFHEEIGKPEGQLGKEEQQRRTNNEAD